MSPSLVVALTSAPGGRDRGCNRHHRCRPQCGQDSTNWHCRASLLLKQEHKGVGRAAPSALQESASTRPRELVRGEERRLPSPPSNRRRMLSVLWIWTPSLLARACNSAVFPATEQPDVFISWRKIGGQPKRQEEKQSALPTRWSNTQETQPFFQQASAVPVKAHSCEDRVTGHRCKAGGGPRGHVCHSTGSFRAHGHRRAMETQPHPMPSWLQTPSMPDASSTQGENRASGSGCSLHTASKPVSNQTALAPARRKDPEPLPCSSPPILGPLRQGTQTMFISCVDISPQLKQALEARQPLGLLAGQIQRAALMDLHRVRQKEKKHP